MKYENSNIHVAMNATVLESGRIITPGPMFVCTYDTTNFKWHPYAISFHNSIDTRERAS